MINYANGAEKYNVINERCKGPSYKTLFKFGNTFVFPKLTDSQSYAVILLSQTIILLTMLPGEYGYIIHLPAKFATIISNGILDGLLVSLTNSFHLLNNVAWFRFYQTRNTMQFYKIVLPLPRFHHYFLWIASCFNSLQICLHGFILLSEKRIFLKSLSVKITSANTRTSSKYIAEKIEKIRWVDYHGRRMRLFSK